jgi:hypothetical protein
MYVLLLWLSGNQAQYSFRTVILMSLYNVLHTSQVVGMSSEGNCTSFHSLYSINSSTHVNTTAK